MEFLKALRCVFCRRMYPAREIYTCPRCGISGILDVVFDYPAIKRSLTRRALVRRKEPGQWRYRELLPIRPNSTTPELSVGGTPLTRAPKLARHIGLRQLFLKDDGRNATGSLKDR